MTVSWRTGVKHPTFAMKSLIFALTLSTLTSCSWVSSKRSLFGDEEGVASTDESAQMVPKSQFDELSRKYEALLKERRIEQVEDVETKNNNAMMNQVESGSVIDPDIIADKLSQVKSTSELGGTVDVFSQSKPAPRTQSVNLPAGQSYDSNVVEAEINQVRKAEALVAQNRFDEALTIIKKLEKSNLKQIVVRAKFLLGEILFKGGDYDLSMQVFEEVINQYAFSGLVIKTLGRLIVCSDKLKLAQKQEKYYSILHDFFEQG